MWSRLDYHRTIKGIEKITACLEDAMLNTELQKAFERTQTTLKNDERLVHIRPKEPLKLTTNPLDIGIVAELAQYHEGKWHPISSSRKSLRRLKGIT